MEQSTTTIDRMKTEAARLIEQLFGLRWDYSRSPDPTDLPVVVD